LDLPPVFPKAVPLIGWFTQAFIGWAGMPGVFHAIYVRLTRVFFNVFIA